MWRDGARWCFHREVAMLSFLVVGTPTVDLSSLKTAVAAAQGAGDTAWVLAATVLVLLMTVPGLGLFYGGMVGRKNILSTLAYSLGAAVVVGCLWVVIQYSLAFSGAGLYFGDLSKAVFQGVTKESLVFTVPELVFGSFQMMFAVITVALISGAVIGRMSLTSWLGFAAVWSLLVYAPLAHMVWGGGLLSRMSGGLASWFGLSGNALDFAGGLVVHLSSGVAALVLAFLLGPRVRYGREASPPGNIGFTVMGTGLLWVGWFGFNGGSAVAANGLAGNAVLVTNSAAAAAALVWMVLEQLHHKKVTVVGACTGVVVGLVAITPASGFVDVSAALAIGALAAPVSYVFVVFVKRALGYDDTLDAFGVHAIGGATGALLTGVFANPAVGFFFDGVTPASGALWGNPGQLILQAVSVVIAVGWTVVGTLVSYAVVRAFGKVRVDPQEEVTGLDLARQGEVQAER